MKWARGRRAFSTPTGGETALKGFEDTVQLYEVR
jgi:hypothetical protein